MDEIIKVINANFLAKMSAYPTADYLGIATPVAIQRSNATIIYPNVINLDGSVKGAFFSSQSPFISYHKLLSTNFSPLSTQRFGQDAMTVFTSMTSIQLVIMGMRAKINVSPETLVMQLLDTLPSAIEVDNTAATGIQTITTRENGIDYDSRSIFGKEFQGIKYFIGPDAFFLAARYTIEGTYLKGCASKCNC